MSWGNVVSLIVAGSLAIPGPVIAQGADEENVWVSHEETAFIFKGDDIAAFVCMEGNLTFRYILEAAEVHPDVSALDAVYLFFHPDPEPDGGGEFWYARVKPVREGDTAYFQIGRATDWARRAMRAARSINVSLGTEEPLDEWFTYHNNDYTASGSAAAIGPVIEACG